MIFPATLLQTKAIRFYFRRDLQHWYDKLDLMLELEITQGTVSNTFWANQRKYVFIQCLKFVEFTAIEFGDGHFGIEGFKRELNHFKVFIWG